MKKISCKRGFTLIELLVVVLIIGILAAVAVPQYKKAVWKARYKRLIPLISAIDRAEKVYFLAHGKYTLDFSELDVQMAAGELEGSSQSEKWYTDFMCKLRGDVENNVSVSIKCYGLADGHTSNTLPYIEKYFERDYYMCTAKKNQAKAAMICRALNPFSESGGDKEIDFYF